jgi:tetratricopeptide (TPR) repeat protein
MSSDQMATTDAQTLAYSNSRPDRKSDLWLLLGLIALTLVAYSPLFSAQFTQRDDPVTVSKNAQMLAPPRQIISFWTNLKEPTGDIYIPLTQTLWYGLAKIAKLPQPNAEGIRLSAMPFHVANVVLHALSGCIVFLILRRLIRNSWAAAAGAALYLLHPIQVEAVGWVSGTKDILGGLFSLAAIYCFVRFVEHRMASTFARASTMYGMAWYLLGTACFVLAMFAKPASVVTPLLAFVLGVAVAVVHRLRERSIAGSTPPVSDEARAGVPAHATQSRSTAGCVLLKVAIPLIFWLILAIPLILEGKRAQPASMVHDVALWQRPLVAGDALAFYLGKLMAPVSLTIDYSRTPAAIAGSGEMYWTWAVPIALLLVAFVLRKRVPLLLAAVLLFFLAPLPVLGLVKFDYQYFSTVSDRYVYVGMLGAALAAALIVARVGRLPITWLASGAVCLGLAVLSFIQSGYWRSDLDLFIHSEAVNPDSIPTQLHLARLYSDHDVPRALEHFERLERIAPDDVIPHREIATLLMQSHEFGNAAEEFRAAVRQHPDDIDLRIALGVALAESRRFAEAQTVLEEAARLDPKSASAQANLANVYAEQGNFSGAADHYHRALAIDPAHRDALRGLQVLQSMPK